MSMEMSLLQLSKDRQRFFRLVPDVPRRGLEETTMIVVRALRKFYKEFPDVQQLDMDTFTAWFKDTGKSMQQDRMDVCLAVLQQMRKDIPKEMEEGMAARLLSVAFNADVAEQLRIHADGGEVDILTTVGGLVESYENRLRRRTRMPLVETSAEDLIAEDMDDSGIKFRLSCLRESMRGTRGGDFGIWAMRPDAGKTTLLCSEAAYWLPQLDTMWPGQERNGVWLNNEGPGGRIKKRFYQAVLGMTNVEIAELVEEGRMRGEPLFTNALEAKLGMPLSRMRFYDIHDMSSSEVERIIKASNPGFVIFDMLDNVKWDGFTSNGGERTDQILEAQYQGARNWAVKYDFVGHATSQLSVDAEGEHRPGQHMLKDSKTGKQGACDFIITGGKDNDPAMARTRWINTPKNKLVRTGRRPVSGAQVLFEGDIAQVLDPRP